MKSDRTKGPRPPLDQEALERLAIFYVGRYATTRSRLRSYLQRKVKERGWDGTSPPDLDALVGRLAELGYVSDAAFAAARASSLQQRGYGERRITQSLRAAGVESGDVDDAREEIRPRALEAALRYARRRRIGPYAEAPLDRASQQKAFAAMMRAGHGVDVVRQVLNLSPGDIPESDEH